MTDRAAERDRNERLARACRERDTAFLVDWLQHHPDDSTLAARCLAGWGEPTAVPPLCAMLRSDRTETRRTAARALGLLGPPPDAKDAFAELAGDDPDPAVRAWALAALGKYRDERFMPKLLGALGDTDWRVRNGAAVGLGELGNPAALPALEAELRRLRFRPVDRFFGRKTCKHAIEVLRQAASSPHLA